MLKIRDLEPAGTVTRELALFKIAAEAKARSEVLEFCEIFRGRVVDSTKRSVMVEVTGDSEKIDAFERVVRPYGLIEMMRTGEIAMSRGRAETWPRVRRAAVVRTVLRVVERDGRQRSPFALPDAASACLEVRRLAARRARGARRPRRAASPAVSWRLERRHRSERVVFASRRPRASHGCASSSPSANGPALGRPRGRS